MILEATSDDTLEEEIAAVLYMANSHESAI